MGTVTAKHLKQKTGEVIRRIKAGERVTVTYRGKPVAVIIPPPPEDTEILNELRSFDDAWEDIEQTLAMSKPEFQGWREAIRWIRKRI